MNVSYRWLRDFLPGLDRSPDEVAELLTGRVATVEGVERVRGDLAPFVVAQVVDSRPIAGSDKLTINRVDAGTGELIDVVCGAPNVRVGAKYPFAKAGVVMPGGQTIERRKIRGETSNGMLCSARELGLGEEHAGVLELDPGAVPGSPILEVLRVGDTRLVLDVLPNRADLLSHLGVAREVAAATGEPFSETPVRALIGRVPTGVWPSAPDNERGVVQAPPRGAYVGVAPSVTVRLEDPEGAPRYLGVVVRGVTVGESPPWLRERLEAVAARTVNNVVDVTNFMLHGFGQPMHAFDLSKLGGGVVAVRRARPGEVLVTLDGVSRTLDSEVTVIADAECVQAIAGVMGGRGSEVTDGTTDIFLEVAAFDPRRVRRTRRLLGLATDASYRFERGVDVGACRDVLALAVELMMAVAGGRVEGAAIDLYPGARPEREVAVRVRRVERILGIPVGEEEVEGLLRSVGFSVRRDEAEVGHLLVRVPSWRMDVEREIDLIEEVARLRGYDTLPDDLRPYRPSAVSTDGLHRTMGRVREALVGVGLLEARPMPFVGGGGSGHVRVANPLAADEAYLRRELLETLGRRAEHNLAQMQRSVRLFEIGAAFAPGAPGAGEGPCEEVRVAAVVVGERRPPHWTEPVVPAFDAWDAKWLAEVMARAAEPLASLELRPGSGPLLWEVVLDGVVRGWVRSLTLDAPVWAAPAFGIELTLETVDAAPVAPPGAAKYAAPGAWARGRVRAYRPLPTTPYARFDIALLVPNDLPVDRVEHTMRGALTTDSGPQLEELTLVSEFQGAGVPTGYRSVAWQITLRHPARTVASKEVAGRRERLLRVLEGDLGVRIR
jgi:phenylalanyl-tRNA synthetase beta chain